MVVMSEAPVDVGDGFDPPLAVRERLEAFGVEVLAEAMNRRPQRRLVSARVDRAGRSQVA